VVKISIILALCFVLFMRYPSMDQLLNITSNSSKEPEMQEVNLHTQPIPTPDFLMAPQEYANSNPTVPQPPFTAFDPVQPRLQGMVVPDIVHYIWLDNGDSLHLTFSQYLSMKSVIKRQNPAKIYMSAQ
jgi:hypothetical protein